MRDAPSSLRALIAHRRRTCGAKPYLEHAVGNRQVTYEDLEIICERLEARLNELGVSPGDAVLVASSDLLAYATAFVAVVAAGRVAVPVDPRAPASEIAALQALARPVAALAGDGFELTGRPRTHGRQSGRTRDGQGGVLLATSGTSGEQKVVLLREPQLCHVATSVARHHHLDDSDRGLSLLPLFHINAEVVGLLSTLEAGATLLLAERFHRGGFWDIVTSRRVTWINAVPAIIAILTSTDPPPRHQLRRVRFIRSASAPLAAETMQSFEELTGIPVLESYGMTEAASMITANPLAGRRPGSAGRPVGTFVRVVGEDNEICPARTVGRVQIRGRGVITTYLRGGRNAFTDDGWLDTKDLGFLSEDGFLYLVGRADDVINRGGEKVYPREIEEVLLSHPDVIAAAVVAQRDPVLGARPVAFVVARSGGDELKGALLRLCSERLSAYKAPAEFRLVEALPLGATGKLARHELRQLAGTAS